MRPILLSHADSYGGAARAAYRIHRALLANGTPSRLWVANKKTDDYTVEGPPGELGNGLAVVRALVGRRIMRLQRTPNPILHSPALLPSSRLRALNAARADVVNLHWVNEEFLSISDIGRLTKPVVWTLHDMWSFSGAEHYGEEFEARWKEGYTSGNRPPHHGGLDLDRWTWNRKRKHWTRPMLIVAASEWLARCAKESTLMRDWPVRVIPNALDTNRYQPVAKEQARQLLGLPPGVPIVLFGAIGGARDPRKGWDLLQPALSRTAAVIRDLHGVIFGQSEPADPPKLGLPLCWLGSLADDATLALAYSAADVVVVPSRQEAFGQAASEAQSCGRPVVAFDCTGLTDVVSHRQTGYLAKPYDVDDLAAGIAWTLNDQARLDQLGAAARERACNVWTEPVVARQYLAAYSEAMEMNAARRTASRAV